MLLFYHTCFEVSILIDIVVQNWYNNYKNKEVEYENNYLSGTY